MSSAFVLMPYSILGAGWDTNVLGSREQANDWAKRSRAALGKVSGFDAIHAAQMKNWAAAGRTTTSQGVLEQNRTVHENGSDHTSGVNVINGSQSENHDTTRHKVFLTYAHGDERPEQIFGDNAGRLREVKRKWDPENVFCWGPDIFAGASEGQC
jgi:hypothetical protein